MNVPCDKFYSVEDVMSILGVGRSKAYDVMKKFNEEMEAHGYYTVSGRVSKSYFDSRTMYDPAAKPPWANELKKASGLNSRTGKGR